MAMDEGPKTTYFRKYQRETSALLPQSDRARDIYGPPLTAAEKQRKIDEARARREQSGPWSRNWRGSFTASSKEAQTPVSTELVQVSESVPTTAMSTREADWQLDLNPSFISRDLLREARLDGTLVSSKKFSRIDEHWDRKVAFDLKSQIEQNPALKKAHMRSLRGSLLAGWRNHFAELSNYIDANGVISDRILESKHSYLHRLVGMQLSENMRQAPKPRELKLEETDAPKSNETQSPTPDREGEPFVINNPSRTKATIEASRDLVLTH